MGVEIEGFPAAALSSRARRRQQQPVANLSLVVPSLMPHNCPTRGLRRHRTTPGRLRHLIEASARVEASPEKTELGAGVLCPLGWAARMAIDAGVERRDGKNHVVATSRYFSFRLLLRSPLFFWHLPHQNPMSFHVEHVKPSVAAAPCENEGHPRLRQPQMDNPHLMDETAHDSLPHTIKSR